MWVVQPDGSKTLRAGNAVLKIPVESRARTYQVVFSEGDNCGEMALGCVNVWFYTAEGEREYEVWSLGRMEISFTLSKSEVEDFGGLDTLFHAYATGSLTLQVSDRLPGRWNDVRPIFFEVNTDGSVTVSALTRYIGSTFRLYVAPESPADASGRTEGSVSATSPTPTAVVEPTATAEPRDTILPRTGGGLSSMTLILALAAAAIFMSLLVTISIADRSRPDRG